MNNNNKKNNNNMDNNSLIGVSNENLGFLAQLLGIRVWDIVFGNDEVIFVDYILTTLYCRKFETKQLFPLSKRLFCPLIVYHYQHCFVNSTNYPLVHIVIKIGRLKTVAKGKHFLTRIWKSDIVGIR